MPGGELSSVTSSTRTDAAGRTDVETVHEVLLNGSRPRCDDPEQHSALPSSVIHELRTPLTSIHGYAQVLQRSLKGEPRAANAIAVVVRESTRLSAMLAALSELAELESDDERPRPSQVQAEDVVDGVIWEASRRDDQAHPVDARGRGTALCDPSALGQAFLHVLTNAFRYSDAGMPVSVAIREEPTSVVIEVADRGIGIDDADAARLYGRFERGTVARQAGIRGLGLGLFLARERLGEYDGTVSHEPRNGGGTVFRITVPRA